MDYEKAYKEVLSRAKTKYDSMMKQGVVGMAENIAELFPELKESEDEKWINWLIGHLEGYINQTDDKYAEVCKKAIAWLKKQEKKTWLSKDDEYTLARIIERLEDDECPSGWIDLLHDIYAMPYQKPIEWSEADENRFANLIFLVEASDEGTATKKGFIEFINRLKTYPAQPQWKPSEEQMNALKNAAKHFGGCDPDDWDATLESLYNDLKNLM